MTEDRGVSKERITWRNIMGAQQFVVLAKGTDAKAALEVVAEEDRYENGHSYSGGIGCAGGFFVKLDVAPISAAEAEKLAWKLHSEDDSRVNDKWGNFLAIPVKLAEREVPIEGLEGEYGDSEELTALALEKARSKKLIRRGEKAKSFWMQMYSTPRTPSYGYGYGYNSYSRVKPKTKFSQGSGTLTLVKGKTALANQTEADAWIFVGTAPS